MQSHHDTSSSSFSFPSPPTSSPPRLIPPTSTSGQEPKSSVPPSPTPSARRVAKPPPSLSRYSLRQSSASSLRGKSSLQNFNSTLGSVPEQLNSPTIPDHNILDIPHSVHKVKVSKPRVTAVQQEDFQQAVSGIDWLQVHTATAAQVPQSKARPASVRAVIEPPRSPHQSQEHKHPANRVPHTDMSHLSHVSHMSHHSRTSSAAPSVFDDHHLGHNHDIDDEQDGMANHYSTEPTTRVPSGDEGTSYDLKPPPPSQPLSNVELLHERLFSADHLKVIIRDHTLYSRFSSFLTKYRPHASQALARYVETQKAVAAVDYANAIAHNQVPGTLAALLEDNFEDNSREAIDELVNDALPGYVTHRLTQVVTETLVKEITGQNTPIMRELVNGLAEVYCLTDPSLPDNPIVYASEEFYRTSQYGKDYVIGRNCRFLQGPRSSGATVSRMVEALAEGQEICETILNYRRDGSPFLNLLLIAPLYDNKGTVRYFIGAQVDVNGLIENGRGLDSFERLLAQNRQEARYGEHVPAKTPHAALGELSNMLNDNDMEIVRHSGRETSARRGSGSSTPVAAPQKSTGRRYVGMDDPSDRHLWPAPSLGPSGRLPGVFQNYLLVRPYPSLRITFTSPALRIPGLLQSRFLDRIGGAPHIREGILSAMSSGIGVTAKITWIPTTTTDSTNHSGSFSSRDAPHYNHHRNTSGFGAEAEGKHRWVHCTPLLGSDEKVGVWMVVMVESESITGSIHSQQQNQRSSSNLAYAPDRGNITSPVYAPTSNKLYNQYLRREGRNDSLIAGQNQFQPGPGTSQHTLNNHNHISYHQPQPQPQAQSTAGPPSKQSSTRSRTHEAHTLRSPIAEHAQLAQTVPGSSSNARGGSAQHQQQQQTYEIRTGPYTGHTAQSQSQSSAARLASSQHSGMGTGNIAGSAAAVYGPMAAQQDRERDVYERSREEKEARVRELRERAEEPFAGF